MIYLDTGLEKYIYDLKELWGGVIERQRDLLSIDPFRRWWQQPRLSQAKTRTQKFHLGLPQLGLKHSDHFLLSQA